MFNEEKTHIWTRARWTPTHFAFLCKRYTTFLGIIYAALRKYPVSRLDVMYSLVCEVTSGLQPQMDDHVSDRMYHAQSDD